MKKSDLIVLEKFHADCVRFWERELKVEVDTCREVYLNALDDVKSITTNPFIPFNSPKLDVATKEYFVKRCEMDLGLNEDFMNMKWIEEE